MIASLKSWLLLAKLATELGLAGIIATNTTISRENLITAKSKVDAMGAGGLSGVPLKARSLEVLQVLKAVVGDGQIIISVGGIETASEARERLAAGATLVQGYTGFIFDGPFWARKINRGI